MKLTTIIKAIKDNNVTSIISDTQGDILPITYVDCDEGTIKEGFIEFNADDYEENEPLTVEEALAEMEKYKDYDLITYVWNDDRHQVNGFKIDDGVMTLLTLAP